MHTKIFIAKVQYFAQMLAIAMMHTEVVNCNIACNICIHICIVKIVNCHSANNWYQKLSGLPMKMRLICLFHFLPSVECKHSCRWAKVLTAEKTRTDWQIKQWGASLWVATPQSTICYGGRVILGLYLQPIDIK